jgi:hypothetical protein
MIGAAARSLSGRQARRGPCLPLVVLGAMCAISPGARPATAAPLAPSGSESLQVLITTSDLVVGQNRFGFALLKDDQLLDEAKVTVRVYDIREPEARLTSETAARYHRLEIVERGRRVHIHPDGTRHVHDEATDVRGLYVAQLTFERPGDWGLEIVAQQNDRPVDSARLSVQALAVPRAPLPGTPAPRSRNLIATDVKDLRTIDSSEPPDVRLHRTRIADAIAQGRPQVIVFATPRYCASRVCGPVVDVVRTLIAKYGDRVAFIHEEIWQSISSQTFSPTVKEWHLPSEPWIFVVDGEGIIRARFEGLTTQRELEAAVRHMLGLSP